MYRKIVKKVSKILGKNTPGYRLRRLLFIIAGYYIGKPVYIGEDLIIIDELDDRGMVTIGNRVAIAERVTLVVSSRANFSNIHQSIDATHGRIVIGDDAWLGTGCIILPNVSIGRGAVVGAGSVVTKDVPDYTVVVGVPAKELRKINLCSNV